MNSDELITELKKTKDQIKDLNNEVKELKEREDELARSLMAEMDKSGLKRMANDLATVSVATEAVPNVDNWDELRAYIKDKDLWELLHKRVSATAWRELARMETIPGVSSRELTKLNFRTA